MVHICTLKRTSFYFPDLVMPDGIIKSEDPHPGLLQSSSIWFHACNNESIIDNPFNGTLNFTICHGTEDPKHAYTIDTLVYDKVDDYFKMHSISTAHKDVTDQEVCCNPSCLFLPVKAEVIGVDDYDDSELYMIIKPSKHFGNSTMTVNRILGNAVYGRVAMIRQPENWDVYGQHSNTLFKIYVEK